MCRNECRNGCQSLVAINHTQKSLSRLLLPSQIKAFVLYCCNSETMKAKKNGLIMLIPLELSLRNWPFTQRKSPLKKKADLKQSSSALAMYLFYKINLLLFLAFLQRPGPGTKVTYSIRVFVFKKQPSGTSVVTNSDVIEPAKMLRAQGRLLPDGPTN